MPLLHIRLTKPQQEIRLNQHINAQTLILKKITAEIPNNTEVSNLTGNLEFEFPFFSGNEIVSSTNTSRISFNYNKDITTEQYIDCDYHINLYSEDIPLRFIVKTFGYFSKEKLLNSEPAILEADPTDDSYKSLKNYPLVVDLYFEYKTNGAFF